MSASPEADRIIARWEWRMIHSPQGAIALRQRGAPDADEQIAALGEQAKEEMRAAHQAARRDAAARVEELGAQVEELGRQIRVLGASEDTAVITPRRDVLPRVGTVVAVLLTAAIAAAAVFATGAFLGLHAISTYVPEVAVVILAALVGGIAGDALTRIRTAWAIAIAADAVALGALAAFLVAWVAGLSVERRVLLAVLFLSVALAAGAIWALASISGKPRSEDAHEVAVARRVAGLGEARSQLRLAQVQLGAIDAEWEALLAEVRAVCERVANMTASSTIASKFAGA